MHKRKAWTYVNYVLLWIDTHVIERAWQFVVSSTGFYENFIYYLGTNPASPRDRHDFHMPSYFSNFVKKS